MARPSGPGWSWPGAVALVLATTVGLGWAISMIIAVLEGDDLSRTGATLLYVLGGTLIGGVVTWLGSNVREKKDTKDPGQEQEK